MGWRYSAGSRHQLASVQQLEVKPVADDSHIQAQDPPQSTPTDHCEANHIRNWRSGSAGLFRRRCAVSGDRSTPCGADTYTGAG